MYTYLQVWGKNIDGCMIDLKKQPKNKKIEKDIGKQEW